MVIPTPFLLAQLSPFDCMQASKKMHVVLSDDDDDHVHTNTGSEMMVKWAFIRTNDSHMKSHTVYCDQVKEPERESEKALRRK